MSRRTKSKISRGLKTRVKTAKGRRLSSTRWLERQLNDPYVLKAQEEGYRSRAAYKLKEIDDRYHFLKKGSRVVDLGATPGGWTQVAVERTQAKVISVDLVEMTPIPGAEFILGDFTEEETLQKILSVLEGKVDVVLSDMAAPSTGHRKTDHLKIIGLVEIALDFAEQVLSPGGAFVAKVLVGGTEKELLNQLKQNFAKVSHVKPPASRKDSSEMYVVALGFKP